MDYGDLISESIEYSREALAGNIKTWLIFIICSLPFALIQFTFDPEKLRAAKVTDVQGFLSLIPWPQIIALYLAGFLLSFFISGYIVRVYRGITPPPQFDTWGSLFIDGIRIMIVDILWLVPVMLVFAISFAILIAGAVTARGPASLVAVAVFILLLLAALVLTIVTILYSILGSVRFARTGSIREGIRFSAINSAIGTIGFGTYIISLIVLLIVWVIFIVVVMVLSMIPFVGWVIALVLDPLFSVFCARYISRVYDYGIPVEPAPIPVMTP